jgi:asparagine synthase (glutamine-hydrolysing)
MCGIAGIANTGLAPQDIQAALGRMQQAMFHRGPDEGGSRVCAGHGAGLCARRLSIVDLQHGSQPMANEDETIFAVLNGEIYNHSALRRMLVSLGHRFRGCSDTEAILHLYEHAGLAFLDQLRGMFALAIFDTRARRLILARDGAGMKPLYFARTEQGFLFASEAGALFASGLIQPEPDPRAIDVYLAAGFVPAGMSAFRGVEKLGPGEYLTIDSAGESRGVFWQIRYRPSDPARSDADYAEELDALLTAAVRSHLAADVPVGAFLSGGWDSSLMATLAAEAGGGKLETFSVVFPDAPDADESRFSRLMAQHLGTDHHEIEYRSSLIPELLPKAAKHMEEPCCDLPVGVLYALASLAAHHVKTTISGEGSDELFGGYQRFQVNYPYTARSLVPSGPARFVAAGYDRLITRPTRLRRGLRLVSAREDRMADAEFNRIFTPRDKQLLLRPEFRVDGPDIEPALIGSDVLRTCTDSLQRRLSFELAGRLPNSILFTIDKLSMAHSLEVRMPFLDRSIMEFAFGLPSRLKVQPGREKVILSMLARRHLPPAIAARKKKGLAYPLKAWTTPPLDKYVRSLLLESDGPFHRAYIERQLPRLFDMRGPGQSQIGCLVMLQTWWNECLRNRGCESNTLAAISVPTAFSTLRR